MKLRNFYYLLPLFAMFCLPYTSSGQNNNSCLTASAFCTGTTITFPATVNGGEAQLGPDYDCLITIQNPAWFYMEVSTGGSLDILITNSNSEDIDFILYGPFVDPVSPCTDSLTVEKVVSCSFSTASTEVADITNAVAGEFYLMMITNFSNTPTEISFQADTSSSATTNCDVLCPNVDWGEWNGTEVVQTPLSYDCNDTTVLLLADEDGFDAGEAISPCIAIEVSPTNANSTLHVELIENGTSFGSSVPGINTDWLGAFSFTDPTVPHAFVLSEGTGTGADMPYEIKDCHTGDVLASGTWVDDGNPDTITIIPPPNLSGTSVFVVTPVSGNLGLTTTNWGGATWDPSAVAPGSYDINYFWDDGTGSCSGTAVHAVTVVNPFTSGFSYPNTPYCQNDADPTPSIVGSTGGTFTATAGIVLNATTGEIDLSASTPGSYTISYFVGTTLPSTCNSTSTFDVTINPDQLSTFAYSSVTYCLSDSDPVPMITGTAGGTFSNATGIVFVDAVTGEIDLSASLFGTHTIAYTSPGPCSSSSNSDITILPLSDASFSYSASSFCESDSDPIPIITGDNGGTFSSHTGIVFISTATGQIDLGNSPTGAHAITYATPGPCVQLDTFNLTIHIDQDGGFNYALSAYCSDDTDPIPAITGTTGGTFSNATGIVFVSTSTGEIDLSASPFGTHTIAYTSPGPCSSSSNSDITILPLSDASFIYSASSFCESDSDPIPIITGDNGGTFSSHTGIAFISTATGQIDLGNSPAGAHAITYATPGPCVQSDTFNLTIHVDQDGGFNYALSAYCSDDTDPTPMITGTTGGTFSNATGIVFVSTSTGEIDLSASPFGTHTIAYTSPGPCSSSSNSDITILPLSDASFSYSASSFCESDSDPIPIITGDNGGTFSSHTGIAFISTATGQIDLGNSPAGAHAITYATPGPCAQSDTFNLTIHVDQDGGFNYDFSAYCPDDADPVPTITGTAGGTFSNATGIVFVDTVTGEVDLSTSASGMHTIHYTTPGPCVDTDFFNMTIHAPEDPSFTYPQIQYCSSETNPIPVVTGDPGGVFSGSPGITFISLSTGQINLITSLPGTHTVTYTTNGICPQSTAFNVTIVQEDDPSFSYPSATFCFPGPNPVPIITGTSNGSFSGTNGVVIDPSTGEIDLSVTGVGTYNITYTTPGVCPAMQVVPVTVSVAPTADFSYNGPYCENGPLNPTPIFVGSASAGLFSAVATNEEDSLVFVNVNTGEIDLLSSDPGTYDVTNRIISPVGGCTPDSFTTRVIIMAQDIAAFTYPQSAFCQSEANPLAIISGVPGGTFSDANTTGIVFTSTTTGEIDLANSSAGIHDIVYTTNGTCPDSFRVTIDINGVDDPTFSYPSPQYCIDANNPVPILTGTPGGFFHAPAGVTVNAFTGEIDLAGSSPGAYQIEYLTPGPNCPDSMEFSVTIDTLDEASFFYNSFINCVFDPPQFPTVTGLPGGSFDVAPIGLDIDTATGEIILSNSAIGSYMVGYTTAGPCPQSSGFAITLIMQFDATPDPVGPLCTGDANIFLTAATPGGAWTGNGILDSNTGEFSAGVAGAGTHAVTYTILGNCGNAQAMNIVVTPSLDPTITNAPLSVCDGDGEIDLDAIDAGGSWSGQGITDTATGTWDPTVAGGAGIYTIYYTITGACGGIDSVLITVNSVPAAPSAIGAISCINDSVSALQAVGGAGIFTWYDDAQGTHPVGTGVTFTPAVSAVDTYTYYVSETLGNCEGPLTPVTLVVTGPVVLFGADPTSGEAPLEVNFTDQTIGAAAWDWDFGDHNTSAAQNPSNTYTNFGEYVVTLTVTDALGCSNTYVYDFIDVIGTSDVVVPNVFSPNGDGINDLFRIDAENVISGRGTIMNRWGQVIYIWNTPNGGWDGHTTSGEPVNAGTYYYIIDAEGADNIMYHFTGTVILVR